MHMSMFVHVHMHVNMYVSVCIYVCIHVYVHLANGKGNTFAGRGLAMRHVPPRLVGRDELFVELAGHHRKRQICDSKVSKSLAPIRIDRIARGLGLQASLADQDDPQETRSLLMSKCRDFAASTAAIFVDVNAHAIPLSDTRATSSTMLQQQHEVFLRHFTATALGFGQRQHQRRRRATCTQSARSLAA